TSDRLRETLFNILQTRINSNTIFLDLCAGTGAVGIEALSRGVKFAAFVDISRKACGLIEENLDLLEIPEDKTEVIYSSVEKFLSREQEKSFDIIFFDPPYSLDYSNALAEISSVESEILSKNGLLVVAHHSKNIIPDKIGEIRRWRIVKQGETRLSFYERN
ncbi:MAG: 16S rRNA (guanine(966)-N(2))-methyltransferase RsmD, partial [Aridibacter sp.]